MIVIMYNKNFLKYKILSKILFHKFEIYFTILLYNYKEITHTRAKTKLERYYFQVVAL